MRKLFDIVIALVILSLLLKQDRLGRIHVTEDF